jgi:hypothetical protein
LVKSVPAKHIIFCGTFKAFFKSISYFIASGYQFMISNIEDVVIGYKGVE